MIQEGRWALKQRRESRELSVHGSVQLLPGLAQKALCCPEQREHVGSVQRRRQCLEFQTPRAGLLTHRKWECYVKGWPVC